MKIQGWLLIAVGVFFAAVDVIYWFWSREPAGTTALAISIGLAFMIGYYLLFTARRVGDQPEDDKEGEIHQAAGEVGFFSPGSYWPMGMAAAASFGAVGVAYWQWWMIIGGIIAVIVTTAGLLFEYYTGTRRTAVE